MTATLSPTAAATTAVQRVQDAMLRGVRSYSDLHGLRQRDVRDPEEVIAHVAGMVQAAAREVVARCAGELALFGRDRDALRNIRFARMAAEDASAEHEAELAEQIGPCFVTGDAGTRLLLPRAGCTAVGTDIDLARLTRFILGHDDVREEPR